MTPLYPTFRKRVDDAIEQLIKQQVTPWSFLTAGPPFRIKSFDGRQIAYTGVGFDGSPREVFWSRYIEPFLEDLCISEIRVAVSMAREKRVDAKLLLPELQGLLSAGFRKVYAQMADVDRRLRGKGFPDSVESKPVELEVQAMDQFLDERIRSEIAMWKPKSRLEDKKKKPDHREPSKMFVPWWKRAWAKFTVIPLGTILAVWGAGSAYKSSGAEDLRTQIYQPLYADVRNIEEAVQAVSIEKPPLTHKLSELKRTGAFERVPRSIQSRLLKVSEEAQRVHTAVLAVNEIVLREMSSRIIQIRSEKTDRKWRQNASQVLRQISSSGKGISDSVTFSLNHSGRSRAVDLSDPAKPLITGPGGPSFVIGDWLAFPASISTIEKLWTDVDYLYFNETRDFWYYQLTRDDMKRVNVTLAEFLKPVYEILTQNSDFQLLLNSRPILLSEISDLKATLADRIRDPKHLGDLVSN